MQEKPPADLVRTTLGVLFLGGLILSSFWILRPFIGAVIWATMLVVATWPVMKWFEARLWRRRSLAVLVMSLLLLLLFFVPLTLAIGTIVSHSDEIVERGKSLATSPVPHPPQWVAQLPFVGEKIAKAWEDAIAAGASGLIAKLMPYADNIAKWLVSQAGSIGFLLLQFLLTVIISALMYAGGESAALAVHRFGRRLAGHSGENAVTLAGQAIRGVALGVGVTAVVQAGLGGVGLAIAGIPFAGLLTAVMLMLCIAQVGPALVMFPAVAWVYWTGENGWGTFPAALGAGRVHHGQLPAAGPDQAWRRSSPAADLCRRDRRPDRIRPGGHLRRTGAAGGGLHAARLVGGRRQCAAPTDRRQLTPWIPWTKPPGA
jgi:predicted PurR-regulated permease PerM